MEAKRPTVIVADDDAALRMLCRVNLELDGYRVLEAASRADVLRTIDSDDVAALLLDIHLGEDDGRALVRELAESRPDLAIAFFTGSVPELDEATRGLVRAVIPKPFTLEELSGTVRALAPRE